MANKKRKPGGKPGKRSGLWTLTSKMTLARCQERYTSIMNDFTKKVNLRLRPPTARDEICAGCWDYGNSFVIEYPFDDYTPVPLCRNCKTRSADYRQRDLIIRNAGRFMAVWDWRGNVEVGR